MSTISASTTSTTAFKVTSDTTGTLVFQTGAVPTTAISIDASQAVSIGNIAVTGTTTFSAGTAAAPSITTTGDTNTGIFFPAADTIAFTEGGVERMRLDSSGNLGLGVTPSAWSGVGAALQVGTSAAIIGNSVSSSSFISNAYFDGTNYRYIGTGFAMRLALTSGAYAFTTAASGTAGNTATFSTLMTLSAAGALSAFGTSGNGGVIDIYANGTSSNQLTLGQGFNTASDNVSYIYNRANAALVFGTNNTERMRLDSSGNLGITQGNNPTQVLSLYRSGSTNAIMSAGNSNTGLNGTLFGVDTAGNGIINQTQALPLIFSTSGTERMRIASDGKVGIASTAPGVDLEIGGNTSTTRVLSVRYSSVPLYLSGGFDGTNALSTFSTNSYANATGSGQSWSSFSNTGYAASAVQLASSTTGADIRFLTAAAANTNPTERARINANGQFAAATSLAGSNLVSFNNSSATGYGISVTVNNNSSGTYRYFEGVDSGPTQRIAIYTNGDVKNTNGVFAAFSDAKLKKDIVDAGSQWDDIKSLRVRKYRLKDGASKALQIGLIAQEVEQVSPGLVNESQDETRDEDGNIVLTGEVTKGVKYSILYMKAVKALQEAMTRIEQLEAKFAALESK